MCVCVCVCVCSIGMHVMIPSVPVLCKLLGHGVQQGGLYELGHRVPDFGDVQTKLEPVSGSLFVLFLPRFSQGRTGNTIPEQRSAAG